MNTVLSQNYFTFLNNVYQLTKGVAMHSPILSIVAEIFLQFYEHTYMKHLLKTSSVTFYKIMQMAKIDAELIISNMNHIHGSIIFSPMYENNGQIHFLELLCMRRESTLKDYIQCKPTNADIIVTFFLNCHMEHKMATYRYFIACLLACTYSGSHQNENKKNVT